MPSHAPGTRTASRRTPTASRPHRRPGGGPAAPRRTAALEPSAGRPVPASWWGCRTSRPGTSPWHARSVRARGSGARTTDRA
ncbi:hypothetical protein QJS66_13650 [Kocuria rhizophila]|nr:hypothetical protein QJS66_13650 [Kocuria rhizophila]